ncbi:hypothetical protein ACIA8C_02525 [Nocardia sp. NPDC051321]|uniref:hypothetical protein n=1 Tax=Nocardia sp. NPDC051321 TaxID=3364323 RepID=UPI003793DABB
MNDLVFPTHPAEGSTGDSATAFMAMLRRIHQLSGLTAGQIAVSSGLPRSTAYRFIDPKNTTVPKSRDQVGAFLLACRLSREGVLHMLELWDEVTGAVPPTDPADRILHGPLDDDTAGREGRAPAQTPEPGFYPWEDPARWRDSTMRYQRLEGPANLQWIGRDGIAAAQHIYAHLGACPMCAEHDQPRRRTSTVPISILGRALPLMLLLVTVAPMAFALWLGHQFNGPIAGVFALNIVTALLIGTAKWVHKPYGVKLLTLACLSAALLAGLSTGTLAAVAAAAPLVGVLTGFTVFTGTPLWVGLTNLSNIATARGAFILVAAAWCGIALGYAASLTMFSPAGAVLVGAMGSAMTVMQLSSRVFEEASDVNAAAQS